MKKPLGKGMGGGVIWLIVFGILWGFALVTPDLLFASIKMKHLIGLTLGAGVLVVGGYLETRKRVPYAFTAIAAIIIVIASGIGVRYITNPFGGIISLISFEKTLFLWQGIPYRLSLPADVFTFVWLFIIIYTMRFLNGLNGLASGLTGIGSFMICFLALTAAYYQPGVALLAGVIGVVFLCVLAINWNVPGGKLGSGGAALGGFFLGTLAVISGGKIATALLVLGIPVLDAVWSVVRKIIWRRKIDIFSNHTHLHSRLLDVGFTPRGALLLFLGISTAFGMMTLFLQSTQKLIALIFLGLVTLFLGVVGSVAGFDPYLHSLPERRRSVLGVAIDSLTMSSAIEAVDSWMHDGGQRIITTPNPEMIVAAQHDAEFRDILNSASLALPDGFGLMLAARWLRVPFAERISGSDFVWALSALSAKKGYTMYLLGAGQGIAESAARELRIRNSELRIVGAESGPPNSPSPLPAPYRTCSGAGMGEGRGEGVIGRIRAAAPDILLVALGHGKQEKWIAAHLAQLPSVKIAMGVGGAFDFIAGKVHRAPRLIRLLGLEWLWRLILQPWRILRIYRAVIVFPLLLLLKGLDKVKE